MGRWRWKVAGVVWTMVALAACDDGGGDARATPPQARWPCPVGWATEMHGGCGPSVLLCARDGGAPATSCATDGGGVFRRLPDGGVAGAWPEPTEPDGPPELTWRPDAGVSACAEGWSRRADGACDPALREDCPAGSRALPGGRCTATSETDCAAGEYADLGMEAMGARVVHVRAGAEERGADGSPSLPFPTVAEGVAAAGADGWVRIAAGTYRERLDLRRSLHLVGTCAARVSLVGPGPATLDGATISVRGSPLSVDLRGVTIRGDGFGIAVEEGASLRAARVVVEGAAQVGLGATGSGTTVSLVDSAVVGTRPRSDSRLGYGIDVETGARVAARNVAVLENAGAGVFCAGAGASMSIEDGVVAGTRTRTDGTVGYGVSAQSGATLTASRVALVLNRGSAVFAGGAGALLRVRQAFASGPTVAPLPAGARGVEVTNGARVEAEDLWIESAVGAGVLALGEGTEVVLVRSDVRSPQARTRDTNGVGVTAEQGAHVAAEAVRVSGARGLGVLASGAGSSVAMSRCLIEGTVPRGEGSGGRGVQAQTGGSVELRESALTGNGEVAALVASAGSVLSLNGCVVSGTRPRGLAVLGRSFGWGVAAMEGGAARLVRCLVAENQEIGLLATGEGTELSALRSVVDAVRPTAFAGYGVVAETRAHVTLDAVRVLHTTDCGVLASSSATLAITRSAVLSTAPRSSRTFGRGVAAQSGAGVTAAGLLVADAHEVGVFASGEGSHFVGADVIVLGVRSSGRGLGMGFYAVDGATMTLERAAAQRVSGAAFAAVPLRDNGSRIELRDGFASQIEDATIRFSDDGQTRSGEGDAVAYGLHAGPSSTLQGARVTLLAGGLGFYNAGTLTLTQGVIASQRVAVGAFDGSLPRDVTTYGDLHVEEGAAGVTGRRLPSAAAQESSPTSCPAGASCF